MTSASSEIRPAAAKDLGEIARIQSVSPEAAQWNPADYLVYECLVSLQEGRVTGFLVFRRIAVTEVELLNLCVDPLFRRRGMGRRLLQSMLAAAPGEVFLEVRESNLIARKFYQSLGFQVVGTRPEYYKNPVESGIVMKFLSC
jgi:ribosomal-protein-alanine N-acetyltransferase